MRRMVGAMHFTYYSLTGGVIEEVMISANSFVDLGEFSRSSRRILSFISANSFVHLGALSAHMAEPYAADAADAERCLRLRQH